MPATKTKFSKCGHRGWGAHCHRCESADKLEKTPPKGMSPEDVKTEAARLRAPRERRRGPVVISDE